MRVQDEYSELTHVLVGTAEGMVVPEWTDYYAGLDPWVQEVVREHGGEPAANVPGLAEAVGQVAAELDAVAVAYEKHGVRVDRVEPIATPLFDVFRAGPQAGGYSFFPADPMWVIGRNLVECRMREPARTRELFAVRRALQPFIDGDTRYLACPLTDPAVKPGDPDYYLEGGDIVIDGPHRRIFVGVGDGRSSSESAVAWLGAALAEDDWTTIPVPLTGRGPIHLLGSMCFVGERTLLAYEGGIVGGLPAELAGYDVVPLTEEEAYLGATCAVMLDPETALLSTGLERVEQELRARGIGVRSVPIPQTLRWDGGIRCVTFVVDRATPTPAAD